jgi:putative PIN family toxin of toxin-antitoxin system
MLKAVLDTNVLISALLSSDGIPNQLLRQAKLTYQLFISREILEEVRDVLLKPKIQRKMSLTEDKIRAFISTIQRVAIVVENPPLLPIIEDDPDDDVILACSLEAKVDYLVSGDIHLKRIGSYKGINVVSPSEFFAIINRMTY